ncbi:MAG: hypothetical protein Q9173_005125 [Seirophora scorigena]
MSLITRRNIGHSEASSSIATIIKLILAIENDLIPPTAGIVNLNTKSCLADPDSPFSIDHPKISQPLCTAVQIGLVQLLVKWNILPEAVVGHSSGEIAAAFTAGYLSAEDAIRIAFYRGKVVASASASGAMLAVNLGAAEVLPYLEAQKNEVVVACHNSPHSVTLSGNAKAIGELKEYFETKGVFVRELRTGGKAYHSHHMTPIASEYKDLLESKDLSAAKMPPTERRCRMMSTVSNAFLADKRTDPAYWALNLENPVLFNQAIAGLTHEMPDLDTIVEIGPHPALSGPIKHISAATDKVLSYLPTLKREENDVDQLSTLAGELWARNSSIDISEVTSIERSSSEGVVESVSGSLMSHARVGSTGGANMHVMIFLAAEYLLGKEVVFPAAGYFAMAVEAARQMNIDSVDPMEVYSFTLRNVSIKAALVVPDNDYGVETLCGLHCCHTGRVPQARSSSRQWYMFNVSSVAGQENTWNEHATGMIVVNTGPRNQAPTQRPEFPMYASGRSWYRSLLEVGFNYGPTFRNMIKVYMNQNLRAASCETRIRLDSGIMRGESSYPIHPGTMDCCLQSIIPSLDICWEAKHCYARINTWVYDGSNRHHSANSQLICEGRLLLDLQGVHCVAYEAAVPQAIEQVPEKLPYWRTRWILDLGLTLTSRALTERSGFSAMDVIMLLRDNDVSTRVIDIGGALTSETTDDDDASIGVDVDADVLVPAVNGPLHNRQETLGERVSVNAIRYDIGIEESEASSDTMYDVIVASMVEVMVNGVEPDTQCLNLMSTKSRSILLVTAGGLLSGLKPEHAMVSGLARCLRSENISLNLVTVDVEMASTSIEQIVKPVMIYADRQVKAQSTLEAEYLLDGGVIYISRLAPIHNENMAYASSECRAEPSALEHSSRFEAIVESGRMYFQHQDESLDSLGTRQVEVKISAVGISEVTVLVFDSTGAAGLAAVEVCRIIHANFIIITDKEDVHAGLLYSSAFTDNDIILCNGGSILHAVQRRTRGIGADVIFSRNTGDGMLQDCAPTLAPFARTILVGGHNPHVYGQNNDIILQFSNNMAAGKSVISYENNPTVMTLASRPPLRFEPDAVYLLVGCLGGLGQSLTSWMVDRGARHLAFVARSGSESSAAASLASSMEARGVHVTVFRGDVALRDDVQTAVQSITQHRQLRGVVYAAMVLNDRMFQSMDVSCWRRTIDPKVKGSLNLHEAVAALSLDFFVLLSSTSGILGTPGQSNYAAANAYQDALALHRRAIGLPAVSLILPMIIGVGYVAENPEIEDSLLRKGIYGIQEDELLAGFEAAMRPQRGGTCKNASDAHLILGFEPRRLARSVAQGETTDAFWLDDRRFSTITAKMKRMSRSASDATGAGRSTGSVAADIRLAKHSRQEAVTVIATCVRERLVRLLNVDVEGIEPDAARSVASYGLDSMIGTEFRSWLFKEFGAEFAYQRLLAPSLSVRGLAEALYEGVLGEGTKE